MKILIVGGGSLGLLFACKLSMVMDRGLTLAVRSVEQSLHISAEGLCLNEGEHSYRTVIQCNGYQDVERLAAKPYDWIFLMVKQFHIDAPLIHFVQAAAGNYAKLLCFQNGIGHVERLSEHFAKERIYLAITTEGARRHASNEVKHTGEGSTWVGCATQSGGAGKSEKRLADLLNHAGFHTTLSKNMNQRVWNKLLINSVINPLTAVLNIQNGELLSSPSFLILMRQLVDEATPVIDSIGVHPAPDLWEQLLCVCRKTANNSSSMLQDILEGRRTEIDWITGSLLRIAEEHHLELPTHRTVYHMIKGLEREA